MGAPAQFIAKNDTPITAASTFTITYRDVGSPAVRPGNMAELENERRVLLLACQSVLNRIRRSEIPIGASYEYLLESAIKVAQKR